jgi:hypothetical protein
MLWFNALTSEKNLTPSSRTQVSFLGPKQAVGARLLRLQSSTSEKK